MFDPMRLEGNIMTESISRRDLFKFGGVAAAALAGGSALAGCSKPASQREADIAQADFNGEATTAAGHARDGLPQFFAQPKPITDIRQELDFDLVVIGAGAPGVPCALAAHEAGAHVALLQKEDKANAHGNSGSGIDLATSDEADVENLVSLLMVESQHRANRDLIEMWAKNSGEAVSWVIAKAQEAGAQVIDQGNAQHMPLKNRKGYNINFVTSYFGPKPYTTGDGMQALAELAAKEGVEVFYRTPAQQLVQDSTGKVTGVIAQSPDKGYTQFNAKNIVIASGDYQSDRAMLEYYLPDMTNFDPKQTGRTGDGHKMAVWAGGAIENIGHTHMLHDFDAGPASMCDMPFMRVKNSTGKRFCSEDVEMSLMNNYTRSAEDRGHYCQIFDSAYMDKAANFPGKLVDPESLRVYMPAENVERQGVFAGQINTWKADTLEELADKLEIADVDAFIASVARWNDLVAAGKDSDFGLPANYLTSIDTPPFYGIHRRVRMSAICSGIEVNSELQCVTPDGDVIEGLYAIGNAAGGFYGGIDYPLTVFGVNLGRNYTQGYVIGKKLGSL